MKNPKPNFEHDPGGELFQEVDAKEYYANLDPDPRPDRHWFNEMVALRWIFVVVIASLIAAAAMKL